MDTFHCLTMTIISWHFAPKIIRNERGSTDWQHPIHITLCVTCDNQIVSNFVAEALNNVSANTGDLLNTTLPPGLVYHITNYNKENCLQIKS